MQTESHAVKRVTGPTPQHKAAVILLRGLRQLPVEEIRPQPVGRQPVPMQQEAVNLIGKDMLLHRHAAVPQRFASRTVCENSTLRSSSPWISSTGDRHVFSDASGDDSHAS